MLRVTSIFLSVFLVVHGGTSVQSSPRVSVHTSCGCATTQTQVTVTKSHRVELFFLLTVLCFQHGTPGRSARVAFLSGRKQMRAERTLAWRFMGCLPLLGFLLSSVTSHRCAATWNVHRESLGVVCRQVSALCDTALVAQVVRKKRSHTFTVPEPSQKRRRSCLRVAMATEQTHQR